MTAPIRTNNNPLSPQPTPQEIVNAIRELESRIRSIQLRLASLDARLIVLEP